MTDARSLVRTPAFIFVSGLLLSVLTGCKSATVNETTVCPQARFTDLAPAAIASRQNPLAVNQDNLDAGRRLFEKQVTPVPCIECHGEKGDGNGRMANMFEPAPRNFTCKQTMDAIPEGQLYWIIKHGSIGTSMPAFEKLEDDQIWLLAMYIRQFSKQE